MSRRAFDRAMASHTARATEALLEAEDFSRFSLIVDVGGGNGTLLARSWSVTPWLAASSSTSRTSLPPPRLTSDAEAIGGDFFEPCPGAAMPTF